VGEGCFPGVNWNRNRGGGLLKNHNKTQVCLDQLKRRTGFWTNPGKSLTNNRKEEIFVRRFIPDPASEGCRKEKGRVLEKRVRGGKEGQYNFPIGKTKREWAGEIPARGKR